MFVAAVVLFMVLFPSAAVLIEHSVRDHPAAVLDLIGKWFVFWAIGVRLFTAGVRQVIKPELTAEGILGIKDRAAWQLVRELGFANLGIGLIGIGSLWRPGWRLPAAIVGGLFLLLAGVEHLPKRERGAEENLAMWSDLFIGVLMAIFVSARI